MDIKNNKDLSKLIDLLHKKRCKRLKIDNSGVEIELWNDHPVSNYKKKQSKTNIDQVNTPDQLSEEDILFWSSNPVSIEGAN